MQFKLSRIIREGKCAVSEREIFLKIEKKYLAHLHKRLKPAANLELRFRINILRDNFLPLVFRVCEYSIFITLYREKAVYIKTHKTAISRPVDHTGET